MTITTAPPLRGCPIALLTAHEFGGLARRATRGELTRIRPGIYAPASDWSTLPPWSRYLARVHAVALVMPDAMFCLESAAALLGLPVFGDPVTVHVLSDPHGTSRLTAGIRRHTRTGDTGIIEVGGILVTAEGETAVDIARSRHEAVALATADAVLREGTTLTREALVEINESRSSSRGRRHARWTIERADGQAESTLESVSRAATEWLGFEAPELQKRFVHADGTRDRVDHWWPRVRAIGEADGEIKYDGSLGDPVAALHARQRRDARLRAHSSAIAHWGWSDVVDFAQLGGILSHAGVRIVAPQDTHRLHTMRHPLRARSARLQPEHETAVR